MVIFSGANAFLLVLIVSVVMGVYVIVRFRVSPIKQFDLIITYFGGLSALLIAYNIYITIQSNDLVEKNRIAYNTIENVQKNYLGPQRELVDYFPEGFFLYASMTQEVNFNQDAPKKYDPVKRKQVELYGSLRVFQAMEDFLSTVKYDLTGAYIWINVFLGWMQSSILREHWRAVSFDYSSDTREFVDRIIEKADVLIELRKKKGRLTSDDYDAISKPFHINYR
jgi:hypothetical protein